MDIGKRIKEFRSDRNLTQKLFAETIGINKHQFFKYEKGINTPSSDVISKIAHIYPFLNINWLLTGNGKMLLEGSKDNEKLEEKPEIPEIAQVLRSQVDDLRKHNEFLREAIEGLQEDKKRLIEEKTELKKEMDSMEKKQTGS